MLSQISEKTMHRVRWGLALGWLILIASLFYDPVTPMLTMPENTLSPFRLNPSIYLDPERCVKIREQCVPQRPYSLTVLFWWAMIVPAGILILMTLGHEFWRRICPLSFFSQIPRALGIQRQRKVIDSVTQEVRRELVTIGEQSWLGQNHLYVQFGLFVLGLGLRILFVNGHRASLGYFLIGTILCAILIGYLYAGKSWCQYFCPMAPVQMVYTGPRALLGSQATKESPGSKSGRSHTSLSQSMCRTVSPSGAEQSACVACKMPCLDIDAEKTYWQELNKPGRRLIQYGYLGMVIGFYVYYFLYAGNWDYYFTGAWTHEEELLTRIFDPGFYLYNQVIPIPKAIAVYITYGVLVAITWSIGVILEKLYRRYQVWRGQIISAEQAQHVIFTLFTTVSFWTFFSYGARPSLNRLPTTLVLGFNGLVVLIGAIWMFRTIGRTRAQYEREQMANSLRKQVQRLQLDPGILQGRSLDDLSPGELDLVVKIVPRLSHQLRLQTYVSVLQDLIEQGTTHASRSFDFCQHLRQELQLADEDHVQAMETITQNSPEILVAPRWQSFISQMQDAETLAKTIVRSRVRKGVGSRE
ncbi:MAG: hypothetical protein MUF49_15870 [Oculatellaceae cyanobacterium Prado106]|nr:hypothetical protein [Oculatellaceae cyanobacterium Prado106]